MAQFLTISVKNYLISLIKNPSLYLYWLIACFRLLLFHFQLHFLGGNDLFHLHYHLL